MTSRCEVEKTLEELPSKEPSTDDNNPTDTGYDRHRDLADARQKLRASIDQKRAEIRFARIMGVIVLAGGLTLGIPDVIRDPRQLLTLTTELSRTFMLAAGLLGIGTGLTFIYPVANSLPAKLFDLQLIEEEFDLIDSEHLTGEQRAYRLFKLHQTEIKRYYDLTLSHGRTIYRIGIACIAAGFLIIGWVCITIATSKHLTASSQVSLAALGGFSGILSNFIGLIFLRMNATSTKSLSEFHARLVTTHHLHFANFLVSRISDESARERALEHMTIALVSGSRPGLIGESLPAEESG